MPGLPPEAPAEIQALKASGDTANPRYMELLVPHHCRQHVLCACPPRRGPAPCSAPSRI